MKNWSREVIAGSALVVLLGGGGLWAANAGIIGGPAQESPAVIEEEVTPSSTLSITVTPTPTPAVDPVVEAPLVEEPADPGPDLCPSGTTAQSSDGYNDLSCAPDVCMTIRGIPDPAYPECDYFYPPEYYR